VRCRRRLFAVAHLQNAVVREFGHDQSAAAKSSCAVSCQSHPIERLPADGTSPIFMDHSYI